MNKMHDMVGPHPPAQISIPASAAADATAYVCIWLVPYDIRVTAFGYLSSAAVTGDDTNSKNLNVDAKIGVAAIAEVAHLDLVTGVDLAVGENAIAFNTGTYLDLSEGDLVLFELEKVGTGVDVAAGSLVIEYQGA